jgi:hypothetical protein
LVKFIVNCAESGFADKLLDDGGVVMKIRVIYKDKNVGRVNESSLEKLIKMNRIAAFCLPNDEWVGVKYEPTRLGVAYPRGSLEIVEQ